MLLQQQGSRVEVAKPQVFNGRIEEVSTFINVARIYIRMKITEEAATTQVAWVLSYIQGGVAEAWKDNLMDELAKGESQRWKQQNSCFQKSEMTLERHQRKRGKSSS